MLHLPANLEKGHFFTVSNLRQGYRLSVEGSDFRKAIRVAVVYCWRIQTTCGCIVDAAYRFNLTRYRSPVRLEVVGNCGHYVMTMSIDYPQSRSKVAQCEMCNRSPGMMSDTGRIKLQDTSGNPIELMKWTCGRCGYTMLFDLTVPRSVPYDNGQETEILPD